MSHKSNCYRLRKRRTELHAISSTDPIERSRMAVQSIDGSGIYNPRTSSTSCDNRVHE